MQTVTVGQVVDALRCGQRAARKLLNDAGAGLDVYRDDLAEVVSRDVVIDLWVLGAGNSVSRRLRPLLSETMKGGNDGR